MDENEFVNYLIKEVIESQFIDNDISDFHPYLQELIKKYDFDIHNFNCIMNLCLNCRASLFLYYYSDAQLTIYKKHMELKNKKEYSDEDIMQMVSDIKLRWWYKHIYYSIKGMTDIERSRIYNDFAMLSKLRDKNVLFKDKNVNTVIDQAEQFIYSNVTEKYTTLFNIKNRSELLDIGLDRFIGDVVPLILKMDEPFENDELFPFMIWEGKDDNLVLKKEM